jgi:hypothetical protein
LLLLYSSLFLPNFSYALYNFDIPTILLALGASLVTVVFFIGLLFFTDKIISILKLDKGFDDNYIKIGNITDVHIVKSAILILGGLLIIDNFPRFINYCFIYFKNHISYLLGIWNVAYLELIIFI